LSITTTDEAEAFSKEWLKSRYRGKLSKCQFIQVNLENGIWHVSAELRLSTGILSVEEKKFSIDIEAETSKAVGYTEHTDKGAP
jgi:hypothetical protein